jgi:hypothetical protein
MSKSDNTGKEQDTRFKPGQSGNPNGRPKGSLNATTLAAQALLDGEAETLTRKAVELAKGGDLAALRLCLDRLCLRAGFICQCPTKWNQMGSDVFAVTSGTGKSSGST